MITLKLPIRSTDNGTFIERKQHNYSYAFRTLFKRLEEAADTDCVRDIMDRFELNDIEYRSLKADVMSFTKREQTLKTQKADTINELREKLETTEAPHKRYKLFNRISRLRVSLNSRPVFGGRKLLQNITKACNKGDKSKYNKLKAEYTQNRILPFSIMGEANRKGNRFFDLTNLAQGTAIYKPQKGVRIGIEFKVAKSKADILRKLSELCLSKGISVSVRLSTDYLYLTYDEETLNGYSVNESERKKDVKAIKDKKHPKELESLLIKDCYRQYYNEQRERKLVGKIPDRCISIDMNPTNIGYAILDKQGDSDYRIIYKGCFDLGYLCRKTGWSSSDPRQKKLNDKRKYEQSIIIKELFRLAVHFRCSMFVMEELSIKDDGKSSKESNRKNKNIWNREFITGIILRRCNESGIELREINPCYTSFIGNIQHPYGDSCSASIEIGRRGLFKYINGMYYPHVTREDIGTLESIFGGDALCDTTCNWVNMYKSLTEVFGNEEFQHRVRAMNVGHAPRSFSVSSYKSRIKSLIYY